MNNISSFITTTFLIIFSFSTYAGTYIIDFDGDDANNQSFPAALFPTGTFLNQNGDPFFLQGNTYIEHGFENGAIVFDNQLAGSHLHAALNFQSPTSFSVGSSLSNDAGGGFIKQTNGNTFALESWDLIKLDTMIEDELHILSSGVIDPAPESHLVVRGTLNGAIQFTLDLFDDTTSPGVFDFLAATNGASGNIDLVEYWFSGTGRGVIPLPQHNQLEVAIDNVVVSAIPVPVSLYLFITAMFGMIMSQKSRKISSI